MFCTCFCITSRMSDVNEEFLFLRFINLFSTTIKWFMLKNILGKMSRLLERCQNYL